MQGQLGVAFRLADVYDVHAVRAVLRAAGLPARLPRQPGQSVFVQVDSERQQTLAVHVLSEERAFLDVHPVLQVAVPHDASVPTRPLQGRLAPTPPTCEDQICPRQHGLAGNRGASGHEHEHDDRE